MTVGKGIGGGLAVSAVVGRAAFMSHWTPGAHTTTFMGNAVTLAAGRAAIGVLRDEGLVDRSATLGERVLDRLADALGDVSARRRGARARPLRRDRDRRRPGARAPGRQTRRRPSDTAAFERGVLLGGGGHHENVVKVCPPLTIETELLDAAVELTIDAIRGAR